MKISTADILNARILIVGDQAAKRQTLRTATRPVLAISSQLGHALRALHAGA